MMPNGAKHCHLIQKVGFFSSSNTHLFSYVTDTLRLRQDFAGKLSRLLQFLGVTVYSVVLNDPVCCSPLLLHCLSPPPPSPALILTPPISPLAETG